MDEVWKDISGYEGVYQISNLGKVKSLGRYRKAGKGGYYQKDKILSLTTDKDGYLNITLSLYGGRTFKIHRLVCIHFKPNLNNKLQVNHIDGDKQNNQEDNLEWVTSKENIKHMYTVLKKKGSHTGKFGKYNPNSKKVDQYSKEGIFIKTWDSMRDIQRETGVSTSKICNCCKGKRRSTKGYTYRYHGVLPTTTLGENSNTLINLK